jgi:SAM-dependent methyltransferase
MVRVEYDRIGVDYAHGRRTDPRWMAAIHRALGDAASVVNVGAGTGSYEPKDRHVVAVEPSRVMIDQRPKSAAPAIQAAAEALPLRAGAFDAALAVLTVHHWADPAAGLRELRRVSERQVIVTFDADRHAEFWLIRDYLPHLAEQLRTRTPPLDVLAEALGPLDDVTPLPVPADFTDGVLVAHWARPAAYLDPRVRAGSSSLATCEPRPLEDALSRLRRDLADGTWDAHHGHLQELAAFDAGYQLVTAGNG